VTRTTVASTRCAPGPRVAPLPGRHATARCRLHPPRVRSQVVPPGPAYDGLRRILAKHAEGARR
jgi:hypothetical protein